MSPREYQRPPIKVALLGLGRSMFEEHIPIFKSHPSLFKVVAACDLLKERRERIAEDFPACKMFRQVEDMLDEPEIDLVIVATPSSLHVQHAIASLHRNLWTLLETPMALTLEDALVLKGAAMRAKNRLIVFQRKLVSPEFLLAKQEMSDPRLGAIHEISIREEDYIRRDDWQCVKRLGGGAAYYAMNDLVLAALKLLPSPPIQMWSELKRVASLGDSEDTARLLLKTREAVSADISFSGGVLAENRRPAFAILGERGEFRVEAGARTGLLTVIDPAFEFPRRRSSVRTPDLEDLHEKFPVVKIPIALPTGTMEGPTSFWRSVYRTVRTAAPFPFALEGSIEAVKFSHLMKKTSPYGK